ncbi:MAG: hypothetical protein AAGI15_02630 [Pseudomonadota bacterium]
MTFIGNPGSSAASAWLLAGCASAWAASDRLALPPPLSDEHPAHQALASAPLTLEHSGNPRFRVHYAGPPLQLRGPLCYRFAGYSETCRRARGQWLTAADPLEFLAPGQVPVELLRGYRLELRAPGTLDGRFLFDLPDANANSGALGAHAAATRDPDDHAPGQRKRQEPCCE